MKGEIWSLHSFSYVLAIPIYSHIFVKQLIAANSAKPHTHTDTHHTPHQTTSIVCTYAKWARIADY